MPPWENPGRELVSVRRVSRVERLTSNEAREVVKIGGWPIVVPKGEFTLNQLVVYVEIDSFLPFDDKSFEKYRSSHVSAVLYGQKGWVVQTAMIDGHVSQGMVFSMDHFRVVKNLKEIIEDVYASRPDPKPKVDAEMLRHEFAEYFDIQRWATFYRGRDLGRPPDFLPDTKLKRAHDLPNLWKTHYNKEFEVTEMLDGLPIMVYKVHEDGFEYMKLPGTLLDDSTGLFRKRSGLGISIGDHDYEETNESSSWAVVRGQGVIKALEGLQPRTQVVLAGVLCGTDISGNHHDIKSPRFYVHSVHDPNDSYKVRQFSVDKGAQWRARLKGSFDLVPTISRRIKLSAFAQNIDELMMKAGGGSFVFDPKCKKHTRPKRKGLVFRALDGSLNFKAISTDWLLDESRKFRALSDDARRQPGPDCV
ncbi:hypothetical protein DHEL01_v201759 [Diaporthe helianthi]|uniref:RNA ligase domain-containing protein n=1 Tax=Diaporthe helianthi TaxID=158607 RepID=A0A2P5IBH3_DIAHE|nr:hypothetical protein DHEL01_v201759 [Diaporthe helianthi]